MEQAFKQLCRIGVICLLLNACGGGSRSTTVTETLIEDPLFSYQWHLNSGNAVEPGINVQPVWDVCNTGTTCRGESIYIAVVDDGLEVNHPDLLANIATGLSHNYIDGSSNPTPTDPDSGHGTSVAGIIAARDYNGEGGRGVAPRASLVGYNVLSNFTFSNAADALTRGSSVVHISSNSWGPADNTGNLDALPLVLKTAIDSGLTNGRNGLGTIYVFAAGNGGTYNVDNSNYDGLANYRGVIAVAALNNQGVKASYSEEGANILTSAPGGEFCDTIAITTTDLIGNGGLNYVGGSNGNDYSDKDYTKCMNGTSAATPMVSGTVALMLQANPNLGWRDVRYILATTARKNHIDDPDWIQNGANHWLNHKYGFGAVDTGASVNLARGWENLGPQLTVEQGEVVDVVIPDYDPGNPDAGAVTQSINVASSGINKIEAVEITFSASDHTYSGDLEITLTSPTTSQSVLAVPHGCENNICTPHQAWVFSSVRHLGEVADGNWSLTVKDGAKNDTGTFQSWKLKIYGRTN